MKSSTIAAILSFSVASFALPVDYVVPEHLSPFGKRSVLSAISDCDNAPNPEVCSNVVTTITQWDASVNAVNTFLNTAESLSGQDLVAAEQMALQFAQLEPDFLAALQGVKGLSSNGMQAAMSLGQVFPAVPGNLTALLSTSQNVQTTVDNINNARCGGPANILEKIGELWIDAAVAANADAPGRPLGPNVCTKPGGNSGDAYN